MQYIIISSLLITVLATAVRSDTDVNDTGNSGNTMRDENPVCIVKTMFNGRVVAVTSIGHVLSEDAARFERGRIWRRPSRMGGSRLSGDTHGRGSATLLASLCEICRKNNKTRCLRQFCSVRGRIRSVKYEVECNRI